jgi:hypothetical protein
MFDIVDQAELTPLAALMLPWSEATPVNFLYMGLFLRFGKLGRVC